MAFWVTLFLNCVASRAFSATAEPRISPNVDLNASVEWLLSNQSPQLKISVDKTTIGECIRFDAFRRSHFHGDSKPRVERLRGLSLPRQTACRRFDSIERFVMYTAKLLGCRHIDFRSVTMRYAISEANNTTRSSASMRYNHAMFHLV